ncbi:M20 family peptidase [Flavobacteriaceae bacterium]|nr:M20 family peptidase [Flavobacteriaceae bacterium]MDB4187306.1 M20 family peptidase [Flavobacteriaceae bacterium]MDB9941280.1 M20 family peptidase [Flavobacteriaceae bacterium]
MKKSLLFVRYLLLLLIVFGLYLGYNTWRFQSNQLQFDPMVTTNIPSTAIEHFAKAIRIKTISPENPADFDSLAFIQFNDFLKNTYPLADSLLEKKRINRFSHIYKWEGSEPSLKPVILMAHLDVVPVSREDLPDWGQPPFAGNIVNDTLWGRGTIDNKIGVIGLMEAVDHLLKNNYQPKRTLYLSFGHDEEIGGLNGAKMIVDYLKKENIQAEFVLDEGGTISQGIIPGIEKNVALIGIAEKGYVSLELSIKKEGGHSSMPEKETAIDILAAAIVKIKTNPFPAKIAGPIEGFIESLGPEMGLLNRIIFANRSLFSSIITAVYEKTASGNALVRTTISPTIFTSGIKDNILPQTAKATVNFRILSGESSAFVIERVKAVIDDPRIQIEKGRMQSEPSKVSSTNSFGYNNIHKTIAQIYQGTLVAPYLVVGGTDAKHFESIASDIYRFSPMVITRGNIKSFHGLNERIAIRDIENGIRFYQQLIQNSTKE